MKYLNGTTNVSLVLDNNTTTPSTSRLQQSQCSSSYPHVNDYFEELLDHPVELTFAILCVVACLFTLCVYIREVLSDQHKYHDPGKRAGILTLLGLYPLTATMACCSVVLPRSTVLADLIASCYLSLCLYVFIRLLIQYYGNTDYMINRLQPKKIALRSPPCCCCCCCCPNVNLSSKSVWILKTLIMQAAIIQPVLYFLQAVMWANDNSMINNKGWMSPFTYLNIMVVISILFAMYGLQLFVRVSLEVLDKHKIRLKLLVLQAVLIFSNLQKAVFQSVLERFGIPGCKGTWATNVRASMISHMLLVFEMALIGVLAFLVYRKSDHRNISATTLERDITYDSVATSTNDIDKLVLSTEKEVPSTVKFVLD